MFIEFKSIKNVYRIYNCRECLYESMNFIIKYKFIYTFLRNIISIKYINKYNFYKIYKQI